MKKRRRRVEQLGPWSIGTRLGQGGNGTVWKAKNAQGIQGAVKLLHWKYQKASSKRFKRFRDEINLQLRLGVRPGILPILAHSLPPNPSPDNPAWLATPLAIPIKRALGRELLDVVEAIASIAECLASLHAEGITHRDIKPTNLYRYGDAWVLGDFGLVDFPGKEELTSSGRQVGPAYYVAPEMVSEAKRADPKKADVYSLGKTLWVLATGQAMPIPGEQPASAL